MEKTEEEEEEEEGKNRMCDKKTALCAGTTPYSVD